MGKLPIILRGGDTPDDARAASKKAEGSAATVAVIGNAVARAGAIADRDHRFSIDRDLISGIALREECARGKSPGSDGGADHSIKLAISADAIPIAVTIAARIGDPARRRRRDAAVARPRGHSWRESEAVQKTDTDRSGSTWSYVIGNADRGQNCAAFLDVFATEQRSRTASDDRDVTIATIAPISARRRIRARDRVIRSNLVGHAERRNRQRSDASPVCSRSIGASIGSTEMEKVLCTVDSITPVGQNRSSVPPVAGTISFDANVADSRSAVTVFELREPIGSDVNAACEGTTDTNHGTSNRTMQRFADDDAVSSRRSGLIARLTGIAGFAGAKRSRLPAERLLDVSGSPSSSSQLPPAKIDPGGSRWTKTDYMCRWRPSRRIGFVLRALLLGLLAMCLLCDMVLAAPSSSSSSSSSSLSSALSEHLQTMETFEDGIEEEELARNKLGEDELEIIRRSIVQGLGLQRIPDPSKANVSQAEYERAHREYLKRVQLSHDGQETRVRRDLHVFQTAEHPRNGSSLDVSWAANRNHRHSLYFPVAVPDDVLAEDVTVDHATLRFLLRGDHRRARDLEALVYLRMPGSRRLLARHSVPQPPEPTDSRWLELDTTEAAVSWLERDLENRGVELEFLHDGRPAQRDVAHASLNVFTVSSSETSNGGRRKRSTPEELMPLHKSRRSKCKGDNNKKCCRHELTVMFKDLKGFDFIVYPKGFDAGYCKGRCPPRYNPAHHHALLQSLLWKEDRKRVPKPCCAPSKLEQLMILYFDENDSTQLKVSYWKNIQVLECACS